MLKDSLINAYLNECVVLLLAVSLQCYNYIFTCIEGQVPFWRSKMAQDKIIVYTGQYNQLLFLTCLESTIV